MKTLLLLCILSIAVVGCKEDKNTETSASQNTEVNVTENGKTQKQSDGLIAIQGEFIYYTEVAVLKTPSKMYGVVVNDKMKELQSQVEPYKKEETDMVPVTIRGRIFKKDPNEEGWEDKIEVMEILKVSPPKPESNNIIKIGNK